MDELAFLLSPIGVVLLILMLAVMAFVLRSASASAGQQRTVYTTLLDAAKKAALLPITVVVPLHRRASSLTQLFHELSVHKYDSLEVVVVVYHTAGPRAQNEVRRMARRVGLTLKTVRHKKGYSLEKIAHRRAQGEAVILLTAHDRLTARFFEQVSFALTQNVTALRVRQFVRLDARMITAFRAVVTLCREAISHAWHRPRHTHGLQRGVIVRRKSLIEPYRAATVLFDDFALERPHESHRPTIGSVVTLALLLIVVNTLVLTTPGDVLSYVGVLALTVLLIVVALLIAQHSGYTPLHKLALLFLLPFTPVYYVLWLVKASAKFTIQSLKTKFRQPRSKQRAQRPQPARTQ